MTRVSKGGPADVAGLMMGDKIMQVRTRRMLHAGQSWGTTWE